MSDFSMFGTMIESRWVASTGELTLLIDNALIDKCVTVTINCKKGLFATPGKTFKLVEENEQEISGLGIETRSIYKGSPEKPNKNILFSGVVSKALKGILTPIIVTLENADGEMSKKEIDIFIG